MKLKPGWNTVRSALTDTGVPRAELAAVRNVSWTLTSSAQTRGSVVFDNFRIERNTTPQSPELFDSWESPLFWRVLDESVGGERISKFAHGTNGLQLSFDFKQCPQPMLVSRLNPPWDLTSVQTLVLEAFVPDEIPNGLSLRLGFRAREIQFLSPPSGLVKGWNTVEMKISNDWIPPNAQTAVEQVEWVLGSKDKTVASSLVVDNFRAGLAARPK